jgi:hypothetical protein
VQVPELNDGCLRFLPEGVLLAMWPQVFTAVADPLPWILLATNNVSTTTNTRSMGNGEGRNEGGLAILPPATIVRSYRLSGSPEGGAGNNNHQGTGGGGGGGENNEEEEVRDSFADIVETASLRNKQAGNHRTARMTTLGSGLGLGSSSERTVVRPGTVTEVLLTLGKWRKRCTDAG